MLANKPLERTGRTPSLRTDSLGSLEMDGPRQLQAEVQLGSIGGSIQW